MKKRRLPRKLKKKALNVPDRSDKEILELFQARFLASQRDIEPEIGRAINKGFWDWL